MAVIKNNRILKCLLMMVVSLFLILNFSIGVSASSGYDRQEVDACITISQRLSVKGGSGYYQDANGHWHRPNGQFASNAEMGIETPVKTATGTHGNSLSDTRTNYGYALVDKDTNEILKFGETIHPDSRYSKNFLNENNAKMIIMEEGNKLDIHLWQHDMNEYYFDKYDEYPPLNSKGW